MDRQQSLEALKNLHQSALGAKAITPGTAIGFDTRAIYVGVSGDIVAVMADGSQATFKSVPIGLFPLSISNVVASGTTATDLVALK